MKKIEIVFKDENLLPRNVREVYEMILKQAYARELERLREIERARVKYSSILPFF